MKLKQTLSQNIFSLRFGETLERQGRAKGDDESGFPSLKPPRWKSDHGGHMCV